MLDFVEKSENPVTNQINAGCYIFRRDVIDTIPAAQVVSVERETFPGLVAEGHLVVGSWTPPTGVTSVRRRRWSRPHRTWSSRRADSGCRGSFHRRAIVR